MCSGSYGPNCQSEAWTANGRTHCTSLVRNRQTMSITCVPDLTFAGLLLFNGQLMRDQTNVLWHLPVPCAFHLHTFPHQATSFCEVVAKSRSCPGATFVQQFFPPNVASSASTLPLPEVNLFLLHFHPLLSQITELIFLPSPRWLRD